MERSNIMRLFSAAFVFFLLFVATGIHGPIVAEGRTCESKSNRFKGTCVRESNCASVCQTEGFPGGNCRGLRRRCFCTRPC